MKISDIYRKKRVLSSGWTTSMRHALMEYLRVHVRSTLADPIPDYETEEGRLAREAKVIMPTADLYRIQFGNTVIGFPSLSLHQVRNAPLALLPAFRSFVEDDVGEAPEVGSLPQVGSVSRFVFPAGVLLVTGMGDVGKTPTAYALAEALTAGAGEGFEVVRFGEPFIGYLKTEGEAGQELVLKIATHKVVVIDSFKDVLTTMAGSLMTAGLSRETLPYFSRLSMLASELGVLLVCPINASSPKEDVVELIMEVARSNVAAAMFNLDGQWKILARRGEGMLRGSALASVTYDTGVPVFTITEQSDITEEEALQDLASIVPTPEVPSKVEDPQDALGGGLVRRLLRDRN